MEHTHPFFEALQRSPYPFGWAFFSMSFGNARTPAALRVEDLGKEQLTDRGECSEKADQAHPLSRQANGGIGMIQAKNPAFFRQRAAFMRTKADKVETAELRASCLTAAADWEKLAEQAEAATQKPPGPPAGAVRRSD